MTDRFACAVNPCTVLTEKLFTVNLILSLAFVQSTLHSKCYYNSITRSAIIAFDRQSDKQTKCPKIEDKKYIDLLVR